MQPNKQNLEQKKTFADVVLEKYEAYISDAVYNEYGLGLKSTELETMEEQIAAWYDLHDWTESKEQFVIQSTRTFIRLLDKDSNKTNLQFIKALTNRIALYLSQFCRCRPGSSIKHARKMLCDALYNENTYVIGLQQVQQARREQHQPRTKHSVTERRKRERAAAAAEQYKIHCQINMIFIEGQNLKIKK